MNNCNKAFYSLPTESTLKASASPILKRIKLTVAEIIASYGLDPKNFNSLDINNLINTSDNLKFPGIYVFKSINQIPKLSY